MVSGGTLAMGLSQDLVIDRVIVPADQLIYGTVRLNGEGLLVDVKHIRVGEQLLPVNLSVFDLDSLPGIAVLGALTRNVAEQSAGQSMQQIGLLYMNPSVGTQTATAGLQAAKTLFNKKAQRVKVTVTSGYTVLLKNNQIITHP